MSGAGLGRMFASLAVPNYRRWFIGGLTSNTGTWMTRTAVSWLVLVDLTHGDMNALGLLTGLMFAPALLLSAYGGTLADRYPKRRIMTITQTVMLLNALTLGVLVVSGQVQLWQVFALTFLDGCAGAIDAPSRQAFVSEVVSGTLLPNAISLNSTSFNSARLIGPGLAGLIIAATGTTGWVFFINAATFIVVIGALITMDAAALHPGPRTASRKGNLREGVRYVAGRPDLVLLLSIGAVMGNFGFNFAITNPIMANNVFGVSAGEFGALGSLMGLGSLAAALHAASRPQPRLRYVLASMAGFAAASAASAFAPTFWVFAALMVPIGYTAITAMVTSNTLVQVSVDPAVRGRVMSLWMLVLMGGTPFVGPFVGWVGATFGPRWTVSVGVIGVGLMAVFASVYVLRSESLRVRLAWDVWRPRWVVTSRVTRDLDRV